MKNKKRIIIIISILLLVIIGVLGTLYFINKKYDVTFTLNGEGNITLDYGSKFTDPGFVAKDGYGNDISENVVVTGEVDPFKAGEYKITYDLSFYDVKKELVRTVTVNKININKLSIVLNGEEKTYLLKGSKYSEKGAYVVNTINNDKFELGTMDIKDNIDTEKTGTYSVDYTYAYDNQTVKKSRTVEVFDITYTISPNGATTGKVKINFDLESIGNYSNIKMPDGKTSLNKKVEYEVSKNGDYTFTITFQNGDAYDKIVKINNIVADYKCTGTITSSGTKISVTPSNGDDKGYEWVIGKKTITGGSTYSEYKIIKNAKVNVLLDSVEKHQVNCLIEDKLIYHFKYTKLKPEIKCDSYTSSQRTKLEKQLKEAVNAAGGKGSRGGTVEAARFILGALDYRMRYQAPRNGDAVLGKYQKEGLNIGNSKAWGCRVAGYINGFDCTHFVEWILAQTGFTGGAYSYTHVKVTDYLNKIKPGDLLYIENGTTKHVAMLIGMTKDKLYVAQSTPASGSNGGTRLSTYNRSELGKADGLGFNYVGKVPYKTEGVVTDKWLTE